MSLKGKERKWRYKIFFWVISSSSCVKMWLFSNLLRSINHSGISEYLSRKPLFVWLVHHRTHKAGELVFLGNGSNHNGQLIGSEHLQSRKTCGMVSFRSEVWDWVSGDVLDLGDPQQLPPFYSTSVICFRCELTNSEAHLRGLVESMPQQVGAVLASRGGPAAGIVIVFWLLSVLFLDWFKWK